VQKRQHTSARAAARAIQARDLVKNTRRRFPGQKKHARDKQRDKRHTDPRQNPKRFRPWLQISHLLSQIRLKTRNKNPAMRDFYDYF
jgi:hypothetical protein